MCSKWINVEDKLPEKEINVIATYKNSYNKRRTIIGFHAPKNTIEASSDDDCVQEYNEEADKYYLCEGWYESVDNDGNYGFWIVHEGTVDYWMSLP